MRESFKRIVNSLRASYGVVNLDRAYRHQRALLSRFGVESVFDVGANVGQTTRKYRILFPEAKVYSFEPFADSFQQLSAVFKGDDRVVPCNLAVADTSGRRPFHVCSHSQLHSFLEVAPDGPTHMGGDAATMVAQIEVATVALDDFCASRSIGKVSLLKMDVQGAELEVLKGAEGLLRSFSIDLIYAEVLFANLYVGQAGFDDVWNFLKAHDYKLYNLYHLSPGMDTFLGYADAIFLSPRVATACKSTAQGTA